MEQKNKINDELSSYSELRLVGDNVEQGIYSYSQAVQIASDLELDLVCISESVNPPVCKVIDYQKFLYQQKKKEKEKKVNKTELKELRFSPQTCQHDYEFKLKHAIEFLNGGNKLKAFVFFSGRQIAYKNQGEELLNKLINDLSDISQVESPLKMEGNRKMIVILTPKKKKK
jgi:translation initiation factor IF-3